MEQTRARLALREQELLRSHRLLDAITKIQSLFIRDAEPRAVFGSMLETLLEATDSASGFVAEVISVDGVPRLETLAHSGAAATVGDPFAGRLDTQSDTVLAAGGETPDGTPARTRLELPLRAGEQVVGMIGLADRPGGYEGALLETLQPLLRSCAQIIEAFRNERDRRAALAALRDSEACHKAVLESAADAIITIDGQDCIESFNPAAERIFGWTRAEVLGRSVQPMLERLGVVPQAVVGRHGEVMALRKDGSRFPIELAVAEIALEGRRLYSVTARDIGERKAAERQLQEALAMRGAILSHAGHAMISTTLDGTIVTFNPAAERMLGYRADELIGRHTPALFHDADEVRARADTLTRELGRPVEAGFEVFVARAVQGEIDEREWTYVSFDGSRVPVWLSVTALYDVAGQVSGFLGIASDLRERKQVQAQLQRLTQGLRAIIKLSPDGFVAFDDEGRLTFANPAFLRMCGCDEGALVGIGEHDFDAMLATMCDSGRPYTPIAALDENESDVLSRQQPRPTVARRSVRRLCDDAGQHLGRVVYFHDITQAVELDRLRTEFLSTAAHELRTPMASIHGFSELLLARDFDAETRRDLLQTIYRQSSNLVRLINELLDLARLEARGGTDFRLVRQPLQPLVEATVRHLAVPGDERRVVLSYGSGLPEVDVDADKLEQALLNVLTNAYKYSPQGGPIEVQTRLRERGGMAEAGIAVRDRGIGMTPEQAARVFERFYRAEPSGAIPGAGLGMSLVKEIVEHHGGSVDVESASGRGTEVTLWLPAAAPN